MKTPQMTSRDSGDRMNNQIYSYFENKAKDALDMCMQRTCDLAHFRQVKARVQSGEDLSTELPALKQLDKKQALNVIKELIKRCNDNLESYWVIPAAAKAALSIKHKLYKGDLIPRFNARYTFNTKLGSIVIAVATQGRYISVLANTDDVQKANTGLAFREVDKRLTLAKIEG